MSLPQQGCNAWYLTTPNGWGEDKTISVNFVCNGTQYNGIRWSFAMGRMYYLTDSSTTYVADLEGQDWLDAAYRTVIFEERPTGDLLTWLQTNGTELSYNAEAWYWNDYTTIETPSSTLTYTTNVSVHPIGGTGRALERVNCSQLKIYDAGGLAIDAWNGSSWVNLGNDLYYFPNTSRTMIFETAPTGDLLAYLQAHATKIAVRASSPSIYIGDTSGKSTSIGTAYIGVADTSRKILKGYIGDENNQSQLFFDQS